MLNQKQKKCIQMMLDSEMTHKQIAEVLKVTPTTISNWKRNQEFMDEYTSLLKQSMKDSAALAYKTEVKLLSARSEMVRLLAAKDVLDRAGFKPDENVSLNVEPVVIVNDVKE